MEKTVSGKEISDALKREIVNLYLEGLSISKVAERLDINKTVVPPRKGQRKIACNWQALAAKPSRTPSYSLSFKKWHYRALKESPAFRHGESQSSDSKETTDCVTHRLS